ncbi:MAG: GTPase, partial [Elusimicrobiota bacterium]|nr:GTPase [Elusimicrobiota bacterium]
MTGAEDTIVALATPPGRSALGIVRLSGPRCRELARVLLGTELEPRRATARPLRRGGVLVDRVVATYWAGPSTPTGEDLLEIAGHGSPELLREIVEAALEAGARPAAPGEFTRRAYVNGRLDLAQARAVGDLIAARGSAARASALARLSGGLSDALDAARAPILELLAALEVRLDHPEEDIAPLETAAADAALADAAASLDRLISGNARGRARREGARVGLFGSPNAGKSTLLNALLGRERAITSPEPGTTRDLLEEQAELAGLPVVLIDTAGLREGAADPAEREGVARARRALETCEVAVLVVDAARAGDPRDAAAREAVAAAAARRGARL